VLAYLKCTLVGLLAGILAMVSWVAIRIAFAFRDLGPTGSGGLGAVSLGISEVIVPVFLTGFGFGFWLMRRRQRRQRLVV
jgi:uncharacterized BrkB/YihY/UPF0761 family membrane protein